MPAPSPKTSVELPLLLAAVLGTLAWFSDKAFTVDDPLFLWLGAQIQASPFDFFGFDVNWNASQLPMHEITQNPPLAGYGIALASALFGWSERALHLAFLVPAGAATLATFALARRYCERPLLAAAIGLFTPVFLISSTNVMCDTTMLAFWCGALACWTEGFERRHAGWLLASALCASAAFLTKYFGIALVPLLLAHGLLHERRLGTWALWLLVPIATAVGYDRYTDALYGAGQLSSAIAYAGDFRAASETSQLAQAVVGLVFAGACLVPALFFAPLVWRWPVLLGGAAVFGLGLLGWDALARAIDVKFPVDPLALAVFEEDAVRWDLAVQYLLFALGGASAVGLACRDLWRRTDPDSAFLFLWMVGTFVFAAFVNWVNNGRSNLPMAPVLGILIVRQLDATDASHALQRIGRPLAFAASLVVALLATNADYRWANGIRETALALAGRHVSADYTTYFLGNWGLQYYMEQAGAVAVDQQRYPVRGDRLLAGFNSTDIRVPRPDAIQLLEQTSAPDVGPVRTMSRYLAGFYAHNVGPLPYAWAPGQSDRYYAWKAHIPLRFPPRPLYGDPPHLEQAVR
ncbi:MAG: glycosyltransferase family 39 protein [Myxococcota bacterium]